MIYFILLAILSPLITTYIIYMAFEYGKRNVIRKEKEEIDPVKTPMQIIKDVEKKIDDVYDSQKTGVTVINDDREYENEQKMEAKKEQEINDALNDLI